MSGLQTATAGDNNFQIEQLDMETTGIASKNPIARTKLKKLIDRKQSRDRFIDKVLTTVAP